MPPGVRMRAREVPLQWYEAIAVVQEVASQLAIGRIARVPSAEQLTVDHEGRVSLRSPGTEGARGAVPRSQAPAAGLLLQELLGSSTAPEALRQLVNEAVATPPRFASVQEFAASLAFFERPGRPQVLCALAGRLLADEERLRVESELDSLTRKARTDDQQRPNARPEPARPRMNRRLVMLGAAVLVAVLLVGLAAVFGRWRPTGSLSFESARQVVAANGGRLLDALRAPATAVSTDPKHDGPPGSTATVPKGRSRQGRGLEAAPAARTLAPPPPAAPASRPVAPLPDVSLQSAPVVFVGTVDEILYAERANEPPGDVDSGTERVYARDDVEVAPPVILRPQLPSTSPPGAPPDRSGALDAVISEDGRVEHIRLVASPVERRYYDAMLLAAAKTWQFRPAVKDGRPVRYRIRIPLTQ